MLLDRALVRQQAIERTIEAIVVHQRRRERQQVLQRGAAIPRLGDVQFARRLAQPGEHEHARHRRPRHRFTPFRQELCQQVVEAQRAPERPPEPYVAEGTPAFQPDALELDRNCLIGRRRGEEVGLLSVPRNRACQRLRAGAPGRVQFTEMRDGLLNDLAADAHRADKAPVAVDLAVLPPRRVTEVHHPAYPSQWRTKSTKLVGTTSTFPVFGSDGGWKYERRGRHDRAVQLLNCGSWASRPSLSDERERRQKKFVGVARSLGPAGYSESESKTHTIARSRSGGEYTMTLAPGCSEAAACTTTGSAGAGVGAMTCHRVKAPMAAAASALPNATRGCLNPRRPCHDCRAGAAAACRSRSMPRTTPGQKPVQSAGSATDRVSRSELRSRWRASTSA